jgi:hypothetical protein
MFLLIQGRQFAGDVVVLGVLVSMLKKSFFFFIKIGRKFFLASLNSLMFVGKVRRLQYMKGAPLR